ncbi:hypothetical protein PENSTE_c002G04582 [Penicillium steckii]|uniref:rRNA adenine N(6)-methyltransferase n=1 Tax=Penicillium steckii TaxID=303698 RepID=A0A1V6TU46_9EURO|nr:hypothetical protein PENSTE_c002G04582 [Penicillium steckii]
MRSPIWTPLARYPLTERLNQLPKVHAKTVRVNIVSEQLMDDVCQRLSPFLHKRDKDGQRMPLDILDLWPGAGLVSSKINELLQPRRHILLEPALKSFSQFLKPLAASKPCYALEQMDVYSQNDWPSVIKRLLPEQQSQKPKVVGEMRNNDTLLVLANPAAPNSILNHYTPGRWWGAVMEDCLNQAGFHEYGSVRILALMPQVEARIALPQTMADRNRPALLTESVAKQATEVACCYNDLSWVGLKGVDLYNKISERVSERSAALQISTPPGREVPAIRLAPVQPNITKKSLPHTPRIGTEHHDGLVKKMKSSDKSVAAKARTALGADNRAAYYRELSVQKQLTIDEKMNELARLASLLDTPTASLQNLDQQIGSLTDELAELIGNVHYKVFRTKDRLLDETRASRVGDGSFDQAALLWDQRPFEPLGIDMDELYPRHPTSILFFEADENCIAVQKLSQVAVERRAEVAQLFDTLTRVFRSKNDMTVAELIQNLVPELTTNQVLRAIPGLLAYADKRWKDDGPTNARAVDEQKETPISGRIEYDFRGWRVRSLPVELLWDIILLYEKNAQDLSALQLSRIIGATLTTFRAGESPDGMKRMH